MLIAASLKFAGAPRHGQGNRYPQGHPAMLSDQGVGVLLSGRAARGLVGVTNAMGPAELWDNWKLDPAYTIRNKGCASVL